MKLKYEGVHHSQNRFVCSGGGDDGRRALCDEESYFREVQNWDVVLAIKSYFIMSCIFSTVFKFCQKNNCDLNKIFKLYGG